jgi:hypothetical protein
MASRWQGIVLRTFRGPLGSGLLHQDPAHEMSGDSEEVAPAFPLDRMGLIKQTKVDFVDQRGGLQRLSRPYATKIGAGDLTQLAVYLGGELVERGLLPASPCDQQLRNRERFPHSMNCATQSKDKKPRLGREGG